MDAPIKSAESQFEPGPNENSIDDEYDDEQYNCDTERQFLTDEKQASIECGELNMVISMGGNYSCDVGFEL